VQKKMQRFMAESDFEAMFTKSLKIIEKDPANYLGYWWRGISLSLLGRYPESVKSLHEALKHADDEKEESKIMSSLAKVFNIQKKNNRAIEYAVVALELNPSNVEAIITRSLALAVTRRYIESKQLLEKNQNQFADDYDKASVYAVLKRKEPMLEALKKSFRTKAYHKVTVLHDPEFKHFIGDKDLRKLLNLS
jgi:tetratricopeptide (TPR) repeat protein